jgi:uncharacterized protein YcfJ
MNRYYESVVQAGRLQAMMKTAGKGSLLSDAVKSVSNAPTIGGAVAGSGIGAYRGYQGAGEEQKLQGALAGGAVGAIAGGFAGYGARSAYKNIKPGYDRMQRGKKALDAEIEKSLGADAKGKWTDYVPFTTKSKRHQFLADKKEQLSRVRELETTGLRGREAMAGEDRALKSMGAYGDYVGGRGRMLGGAAAGAFGLGYGGYQLKNMGSIAADTDEDKRLREFEKKVDDYAARKKSGSF